jgi:hypothetical protein
LASQSGLFEFVRILLNALNAVGDSQVPKRDSFKRAHDGLRINPRSFLDLTITGGTVSWLMPLCLPWPGQVVFWMKLVTMQGLQISSFDFLAKWGAGSRTNETQFHVLVTRSGKSSSPVSK